METSLEELTERYATAAQAAGMAQEQFERFLRAGVALHPQQLIASRVARECDRDDGPTELGYGGARGGGKSHWMLAQMAIDDCQRYPGLKCLLLRKVGSAVKEGFEDLIPRLLAFTPHRYKPSRGTLVFPNGSKIIIGHFKDEKDVDRYLGLEYDVIGIEEATTLTASKVQMIRTCNRTSKPDWRPRMYYTTNPGGLGHGWFKKKFIEPLRRGIERLTRFVQATVRDNPFVNSGYVQTLEELTGWQRKAWLDGDWDIAAGQFFTTWRHEAHVIEPFTPPLAWRFWCSFDYGFTHYTAVHLFAQSDDGHIYVIGEHGARGWQVADHAVAIHALLARHGLTVDDLDGFVAGTDAFAKKSPGQTIAEMYADEGIQMTQANTDRITGAANILKRLGDVERTPPRPPTVSMFNTCPRLVEAIPLLQHDPNRPEDVLKVDTDDDGNGGDDFYDCFRYGIMAAVERRPVAAPNPFDDYRG